MFLDAVTASLGVALYWEDLLPASKDATMLTLFILYKQDGNQL